MKLYKSDRENKNIIVKSKCFFSLILMLPHTFRLFPYLTSYSHDSKDFTGFGKSLTIIRKKQEKIKKNSENK